MSGSPMHRLLHSILKTIRARNVDSVTAGFGRKAGQGIQNTAQSERIATGIPLKSQIVTMPTGLTRRHANHLNTDRLISGIAVHV